jgi:hypothetical protein
MNAEQIAAAIVAAIFLVWEMIDIWRNRRR